MNTQHYECPCYGRAVYRYSALVPVVGRCRKCGRQIRLVGDRYRRWTECTTGTRDQMGLWAIKQAGLQLRPVPPPYIVIADKATDTTGKALDVIKLPQTREQVEAIIKRLGGK